MLKKIDILPDFLTTNDLVNLGLYPSLDSAYFARIKSDTPPFIKLGRRVLYPKDKLVQFIEYHLINGKRYQSNLKQTVMSKSEL